MNKKITYLFGAGASYNACPIGKELGDKMNSVAEMMLAKHGHYPHLQCFNSMTQHAKEANQYGTVDTYAKKLYLNNSISELESLKKSVSLFFYLWELPDNKFIEQLYNHALDTLKKSPRRFTWVDQRYINLLASCLERGESNDFPKLHENVRFITWNYDLQLVSAYRHFCKNDTSLQEIDNAFSFVSKDSNALHICHLNGFHSFYHDNQKKGAFIEYTHNQYENLTQFLYTKGEEAKFDRAISYAWEESTISKNVREQAQKIISETDILIIVGYSFPPFNRSIDKELFAACKKNIQKIIYQDPKGSAEYISDAFEINKNKIKIVDETTHFILPSEF